MKGVRRRLDKYRNREQGPGDPVYYPMVGVASSESCCQATLINDPKAVHRQCSV